MAAFLTPDQVRKVRIKGSTVLKFASLDDRELRVVKMSGSAQLKTQEVQEEVSAGKRKQKDFLLFMLQNSCANMEGDLFTEEDALGLFDILPLEDVAQIVNEAAKLIGSSVKIRVKGTDATVEQAPLTVTEKK